MVLGPMVECVECGGVFNIKEGSKDLNHPETYSAELEVKVKDVFKSTITCPKCGRTYFARFGRDGGAFYFTASLKLQRIDDTTGQHEILKYVVKS